MSALKRGRVAVELAGESYVLVFNYGTLADIESEFGDRAIDTIYFNGSSLSRKALLQAIRHGLTAKHRAMTAKKVARLIDKTLDDDPDAIGRLTRAVLSGILGGNGANKEALDEFDRLMDEAEAEVESEANPEECKEEDTDREENPTLPTFLDAEAGPL